MNMKDNLLLKELILQEVDQERRDKVEKKSEAKLQEEVDAYNESQMLLQSLQKDNEKWEENMTDLKVKANEIYDEKESL